MDSLERSLRNKRAESCKFCHLYSASDCSIGKWFSEWDASWELSDYGAGPECIGTICDDMVLLTDEAKAVLGIIASIGRRSQMGFGFYDIQMERKEIEEQIYKLREVPKEKRDWKWDAAMESLERKRNVKLAQLSVTYDMIKKEW